MVTGSLSRRTLLVASASSLGVLTGFAATGALAGPLAPAGVPSAHVITSDAYCPEVVELEFLTLINAYRKQNGLSSLSLSKTLGAAADHHSRDMASKNYFSHTLANGRSWSTNIKDHGYTASGTMAENIAAGNSSAATTFEQWRNSSTHNANMLSARYQAIGIGRASKSTSKYRYYWTTTFGGAFDSGPGC